jgi:cytochrome c553
MDTGILHLHTTSIVLFLLFFMFKAALLFMNKADTLNKIREKTKFIDMILGVLILSTGVFLVFKQTTVQTWLLVKIVLVLAAIPIGVVGLRRSNRILTLTSLIIFIYIYGIAETKSLNFQKKTYVTENAVIDAKVLYINECARCHGEDGKAGNFSSANLSMSQLSKEEKAAVIKNGKGLMPSFAKQFSDQQIEELVNYIEKLK